VDSFLFFAINRFAGKSPILDNLAIFFAEYLGYILIFFLLLSLIRNFKKYRLIVAQAFTAAILARLVIVNIIRWLSPKPRPFIENQVNLLLSHEATNSFPSGHAAFYFAIATAVYFHNRKTGIIFFLASFLIGISRVFCGIHWPSDILVGAIIGIFSGWVIKKIKFYN
jgi:undecaprenyl-diphosphatase